MAEAKKPAPAAAEAAAEPKKRSALTFVIIGLLVTLILVLGAGVYVMYIVLKPQTVEEPVADAGADGHGEEKPAKKKKESKKSEHTGAPVFAKLDTFTVNLQGGGSVLQTEVHVQVVDEKVQQFVMSYQPRISSQINLLLSSKKPEDLATVEAKTNLMLEMKKTINKVLEVEDEDDGVKSVELKTFIIQ